MDQEQEEWIKSKRTHSHLCIGSSRLKRPAPSVSPTEDDLGETHVCLHGSQFLRPLFQLAAAQASHLPSSAVEGDVAPSLCECEWAALKIALGTSGSLPSDVIEHRAKVRLKQCKGESGGGSGQ